MAQPQTRRKKTPAVDRRLVKELQTLLKENKGVEVLGHLAVPAYCCGNGTVALVKIDKGRPPSK
ncbi:MAG: hypothetical protein ND866_02550 [Pyrinomonadaceae bacterium]|jgi:hypothetical protein|nr:hypothetical protein [Pyrinomonadaceae bacterium]